MSDRLSNGLVKANKLTNDLANNLTNNEIISAWNEELHLANYVNDNYRNGVKVSLIEETIKVLEEQQANINRQKAEIQQLQLSTMVCEQRELIIENAKLITLNWGNPLVVAIKSEAIREFAERLKGVYLNDERYDTSNPQTSLIKLFTNINILMDQMTEQ